MGHRQVDAACVRLLSPCAHAPRQTNGGLRATDDLDVLPGERTRNADAKRFPDRFLAGEATRVGLCGIRPGGAIRALGFRETPPAEARIALQRAPDTRDFHHVHTAS